MVPLTLVTLKVCFETSHTVVLPVMAEGWAGMEVTVTASDLELPFPQALDGTTVTLPLVAPTVTVTEFVFPPAV